jgi:hypothetical protein
MSSYRFTPQALGDLLDIWSFIARDNPTVADRVEEAVFGRQFTSRGTNQKRVDPTAGAFLGCPAVFKLPDCLRPREEAAANHSHPPRRSRPSVAPSVGRLEANVPSVPGLPPFSQRLQISRHRSSCPAGGFAPLFSVSRSPTEAGSHGLRFLPRLLASKWD